MATTRTSKRTTTPSAPADPVVDLTTKTPRKRAAKAAPVVEATVTPIAKATTTPRKRVLASTNGTSTPDADVRAGVVAQLETTPEAGAGKLLAQYRASGRSCSQARFRGIVTAVKG